MRLPSAASLPASVSIALRSLPASAFFRLAPSATTFCCLFGLASAMMLSSAAFQDGVDDAICASVVQRKLETALRRSAALKANSARMTAITAKPRMVATQSSVRQEAKYRRADFAMPSARVRSSLPPSARLDRYRFRHRVTPQSRCIRPATHLLAAKAPAIHSRFCLLRKRNIPAPPRLLVDFSPRTTDHALHAVTSRLRKNVA